MASMQWVRQGALLLRAYNEASLGSAPVCGQFKAAWMVTLQGKTRAVELVLKRGASPQEVDAHNQDSGYDGSHRRRRGSGTADLMREIWAQERGTVRRGAIIPYIAWGYIGKTFWALQPKAEEICGYSVDVWVAPGVTAMSDADPTSGWNCGVYRGAIRVFDWGFDVPRHFPWPNARQRSEARVS